MAEYLHNDDEDKEELPKRRNFLRGDFLSSWLRLQRQPTDIEINIENDEDSEEDDDKTEEKKLSFSERLFRKLSRAFKNLISVEPVAEPALAYEASDATVKELRHIDRTDKENLLSDDGETEYINVPLGSQNRETDINPTSYEESIEKEPDEQVDAFDLAEHTIIPTGETPVQKAEIKPDVDIDAKEPVDNFRKPPERNKFYSTGSSAVSAGEVLRQRQEKKLKKEVIKLKEHIQDLETEQKTVKLQQEAFGRQLAKKYQERPKNVQKPVLEKSILQPKPKVEFSPQNSIKERFKQPEETKKAPEVKESPLFTERFKELIATPTETQPNVIMEAVEQAAEQNAPIENIYEHRHEIKDRKDDEYIVTKGGASGMSAKQGPANISLPQKEKVLFSERSSAARQPLSFVKPTSNDMYKQAVRGGFWTAIILIVMIGLLIIITR